MINLRFVRASVPGLMIGGEATEAVSLVVIFRRVRVLWASICRMVCVLRVQTRSDETNETSDVFKRQLEQGIDGL
jgi:hypothetical protein